MESREELLKRIEDLEQENFNLREGIMLDKMAIPKDKADIRNFYEISEVPSYNQLEERWDKLRRKVEEWWTRAYEGSDYEIALTMVMEEMDELEGKEENK